MVLPALLLMLLLVLFPVLHNFWLAFFQKHTLLQDRSWVFLDNYTYISQDQQFWASFWLGTVYAVASIVLQVVIGVGAALILNEAFWGRSLLRGVVLFPYMI